LTRKLRRRPAGFDLSAQEIRRRLEQRFSGGPLRWGAGEDPCHNEDAQEIVPHEISGSPFE
jgi:hypothetical protein